MKQPAFSCIVLVVVLLYCSCVSAVYTIRRNTQDCIYPVITADAVRLWPTSAYLPRGNSIRSIAGGGYLVDSTAGFSIEYYSTYKIITNKIVNEKYLLYHCGTSKPDVAASFTKVFQLPLTSTSVADATAADFMTQIVLMDRVAYAGELAVSGCLQAIAACGYVAASNPASSTISDKVDAMWIFGFSTSTDPYGISFNAVAATKPLERVKWLGYVGAFFNKEYAANAVYAQVRDSYMSLRRDALAALGEPPLVCWVFKDWDGHYAMSYAPYKVEYVTDAGGKMYPIKTLTDSGMIPKPGFPDIIIYEHTKEDVARYWAGVLSLCDVIIDESYEQSTGGLTEMDNTSPDGFIQTHNIAPYASQIDAITAKNVYTLAGTTGVTVTNPSSPMKGYIGLDWFERGVSRADEVLRDLVTVIRPSVQNSLLTGWKRRFLLRLDGVQQQVQTPAICNLATAKLNNCVRGGYAARICPNAVRNCDTGALEFPPLQQRCTAVSQQDRTRRRRRRQRPRVVECVRS